MTDPTHQPPDEALIDESAYKPLEETTGVWPLHYNARLDRAVHQFRQLKLAERLVRSRDAQLKEALRQMPVALLPDYMRITEQIEHDEQILARDEAQERALNEMIVTPSEKP